MTHQERFVQSLTFGRPDRFMLWQLFGVLPGVIERWVSEGMPQPEDPANPLAFFELDPQPHHLALNTGPHPGFKPVLIEDNDEYRIERDCLGCVTKLIKASATMSLAIEWPVSKPEDWEQMKHHFLYAPDRLLPDWMERYRTARAAGLPVIFSMSGFYNFPRILMGDERLAYAYYDYPQMITDIQETYTQMICTLAQQVLSQVKVDALYVGEDMAYKGGLCVSPLIVHEFMEPYYKRVIDVFRNAGVKIFAVDSDGYVRDLIQLLVPLGVTTMYPFEVRANNDITRVRQEFGQSMAIIGGLDKFCVMQGKQAIDAELDAKLPLMLKTGGFIASLDHRVIVETPFEDYAYYVQAAKSRLKCHVSP